MTFSTKCPTVGTVVAGHSRIDCVQGLRQLPAELQNASKRDTDEDRQLLYDHMTQYVELHGRRRTIGEWYLPRTGGYRMPGGGDVVQSLDAMGKGFGDVQDYFHSTFPDMLIEDLIGFQASHDDQFTIHPLVPKNAWEFIYLGDLRYHGHDVDILWKKDWDSKQPGDQSKLYVWVDGKRVAESDDLTEPLEVNLP